METTIFFSIVRSILAITFIFAQFPFRSLLCSLQHIEHWLVLSLYVIHNIRPSLIVILSHDFCYSPQDFDFYHSIHSDFHHSMFHSVDSMFCFVSIFKYIQYMLVHTDDKMHDQCSLYQLQTDMAVVLLVYAI